MSMFRHTIDPFSVARSNLGALIDGAPTELVGDYARVLEEFDDLGGAAGFPPARPVGTAVRAAQFADARQAVEQVAVAGRDRLRFALCLERLDAAWRAELSRSRR
jgi:hypothetical protein